YPIRGESPFPVIVPHRKTTWYLLGAILCRLAGLNSRDDWRRSDARNRRESATRTHDEPSGPCASILGSPCPSPWSLWWFSWLLLFFCAFIVRLINVLRGAPQAAPATVGAGTRIAPGVIAN